MSTDRINQLHEQASERYLNGDYAGAIEAWRDVLGIDPDNEQAQGGVRMASQFVGPEPSPPAAGGDVEHELEQGLKVLDGVDPTTLLGHDGVDGVDGATDRPPAAASEDEATRVEHFEGWNLPVSSEGSDDSFGLAPVHPSSSAPEPMSAAGAELKRRVEDLLSQAKAKAEAGDRDEAMAVLARLAILDEDNPGAAELRSKLEAQGASDLDKVESAIIEGVAALEADRLDDAQRFFEEALAIAPDHREAKHYLEKVAERRASGEEDLLTSAVGEAPPEENAVALAVPTEAQPQKTQPGEKAPRAAARPSPEAVDPPPATGTPRFSLPPPKVLLIGGVGLVVLVIALVAVPRMLGRSKPAPAKAAAQAPPPVHRPTPPSKSGPIAGTAAVAPIDPSTPEGVATIAEALKTGRAQMAAGDIGGAVVAFSRALSVDPGNAEAKAGFEQARDRYQASKEERDELNTIKMAFRDGEFTSALRLAYRLPPTVTKSHSDGIKIAGWYNLAVVALRAGDCKGALTQIGEALEISPVDADAKSLKDLATRYADAVKDRAFFDRVETLAFRPVPES